jgi:hypothetical protein
MEKIKEVRITMGDETVNCGEGALWVGDQGPPL